MYESKMVCCLKANGKVLREHKDIVYVPFGTEFSVLLKNLNTVRALVTVTIDGVDVGDGSQLVVGPNSEFELTRFIKNGNLKAGNRFKFIERTAGVEQHRGVGVEDGVVRVEFQFERRMPEYIAPTYQPEKVYYRNPHDVWYGGPLSSAPDFMNAVGSVLRSSDSSYSAPQAMPMAYATTASYTPNGGDIIATSATVNDAGITVPGSVSDQQFKTVGGFPVEATKHVMVLRMLGETDTGTLVSKPVTVKTKPKCVTCGRLNKSGAKFCTDCGTGLEIV